MQEAAKAKEAAKRAREAEVFILNPQGAPTTHTVPKPFKLHETTNQVSAVYHPAFADKRKGKSKQEDDRLLCQQVMDMLTSVFLEILGNRHQYSTFPHFHQCFHQYSFS